MAAIEPAIFRSAGRLELTRHWESVRVQTSSDGREFEHVVLRAFELEGARVRYPPFDVKFGDEIVERLDGAVHAGRWHALVECKDHSASRIGIEPIVKLHSKLARRPPSVMGLVFSRSGFSPAAESLARFQLPVRVLLWDGEELDIGLRTGKMLDILDRKLVAAVEDADPCWKFRWTEDAS